jgi:1-acyl-sn-glycerol-3-phosphate acyltransferase
VNEVSSAAVTIVDAWRFLSRRPPAGMSIEEARLAGMVPPEGWRPLPRASVRDAVRTVWASAGLVGSFWRSGPVPATTTADGLARIREPCGEVLRRLGVTVAVEGVERVPAEGGLVFMWNQTSHLDHLILPLAIPRPFHTTYNNAIRRTPFYGRYLEATDHFWLDKTNEAQWREAVARAAERVRDGACLLISPEGTRSWGGRLLPMKRGAFLLARLARRPIVCLTVAGARECLPRGGAAVRPVRVRVELSAPIPVDAAAEAELEERVAGTFERALGQVG